MNIPIELMQSRKTALTAWQLYDEICESGDREAIARALVKANQCDQTSHEWFMRWQAVGGTSDIFSIAEREQENLAVMYVAEFQEAVPDSVLLRTDEPATVAAQAAASIGDLDLAEMEADKQEFRDVKFGSKQWFDTIDEIPF